MKFSINKTELQNALNIVAKGASTRSTLPILSGILVEAKEDSIVLQATDLELSVQYSAPALVEEPGKIVVPAKLFPNIVKNLPDAAVHIQSGESDATITCDTSVFSVRTLNPEDFPGFPTVETSQTLTIPLGLFTNMVKRVSRVVSSDESRAILTGVLIEAEDGVLKMVGTDSYRLALASTKLQLNDAPQEFSAVIAGSFLSDVCSVLSSNDPITLALSENQIILTCGNAVFINRRIEGTYPNYKQLIPEERNTRATINQEQLAASVKRAAILCSSTAPLRFDLNSSTQTLQIFVNSADVGSAQETIACELTGEDVEIALNAHYVTDALTGFQGETIHFDVLSSMKPALFCSCEGEEDYLYLIMPVRL